MPTDIDPVVNNWYDDLDKDQKFKVISLDDGTGLLEVQYLDGELEEIDIESWYLLEVEPSNGPEPWSGSPNAPDQAYSYPDSDSNKDEWDYSGSRSESSDHPAAVMGYDEPLDDWGEGFPEEEPWEGEE